MKHSCGAILYSFDSKGRLGIILGLEGRCWFPFKGCKDKGETYEQAAIREIYEETCGLVKINGINLEHEFSSKNKHYHIGLVYVSYDFIKKFDEIRCHMVEKQFLEKTRVKFFPLNEIHCFQRIHSLTLVSIRFFWNKLLCLTDVNHGKNKENKCCKSGPRRKYDIFNKGESDLNFNWRKPFTGNIHTLVK